MASKYAFVVSCSANYLPGLNALLNGLDLYGNTADIWIIEEGIPEDYKKKAKEVFNFEVNFIPITECLKGEPSLQNQRESSFYHWVFSLYVLEARLKDKYAAIATLGADIVVVNNVMQWFEVAEKTGFIVTANNPYTLSSFNEIDERHFFKEGIHAGLIDTSPISDFPGFMNPNLHEDVIMETLRMGNFTDANMEAFNSAIWNTKKENKILLLNSELWTCGIFYYFKMEASQVKGNKLGYFANRERVNSIHKKYWSDSVIYQALFDKVPGTWGYENSLNNTRLFCDIYRSLNTGHKLKYDYPENKVWEQLKSGELKLKCQLIEELKK